MTSVSHQSLALSSSFFFFFNILGGIVFFTSDFTCSLIVCKKCSDFCPLILCLLTLLNSLTHSRRYFCRFLGVSAGQASHQQRVTVFCLPFSPVCLQFPLIPLSKWLELPKS
jgi:hypothetical protein